MITKDNDYRLKLVLMANSPGSQSEVICEPGDLTCKAQAWSSNDNQDKLKIACFACDRNSPECTKEESALSVSNAGKGVVKYNSDATFALR